MTKPMAKKTHCPQGHPYAGSNLYIDPKSGGRVCRKCGADNQRRRRAAVGVSE